MSEPGQADDSRRPKRPENPWKYVHLGSRLAVTCVIFSGVGYLLDERFGWTPWGLAIGGVFGVAVGLYHFLKETL